MKSELRSKVAATIKAYPNQPGCADTVIALCREAAKGAIEECAIFESYKEGAKKAVDEALVGRGVDHGHNERMPVDEYAGLDVPALRLGEHGHPRALPNLRLRFKLWRVSVVRPDAAIRRLAALAPGASMSTAIAIGLTAILMFVTGMLAGTRLAIRYNQVRRRQTHAVRKVASMSIWVPSLVVCNFAILASMSAKIPS